MGVSDNTKGFALAVVSSTFIGSSFILKKKGLKRAGKSGTRAGVGGYAYLLQPLWWAGMITMLIGEVANFVAYVFAPAALVTPLGALSIIVSSVLSHFMLKERLQRMGILGCISCIVGSVVIVIHAPREQSPSSVEEIWKLATQPGFLIYAAITLSFVLVLVFHFEPRYGQTNILIYLGICSLMGSLTVVSIKAIGIAIKLTFQGISQVTYYQTWLFVTVAFVCVISQMNYLNKDWSGQNISSIASELCGFIIVISGTLLLHTTREQEMAPATATISWYIGKSTGDHMKTIDDDHFVILQSSD
ncbi:probable magnesium transporter NIPA6 isoform X1 [Musa acuminata AAA Group]|uniref:probable magnesium transporter NIPA6 isoform X1 n=1 Tax=Musa acuminata AAA Group TaxID=214697 RepID=UPI0031D77323